MSGSSRKRREKVSRKLRRQKREARRVELRAKWEHEHPRVALADMPAGDRVPGFLADLRFAPYSDYDPNMAVGC